MRRYLDTGVFEVVLSHNRYTLLDRSAEPLFAEAAERGHRRDSTPPRTAAACSPRARSVQQSTPTGPAATPSPRRRCGCRRPARATAYRSRRRRCSSRCARPLVDSTVVGVSSPERVAQTLELAAVAVPEALWDELEQHVPDRAGWLG